MVVDKLHFEFFEPLFKLKFVYAFFVCILFLAITTQLVN